MNDNQKDCLIIILALGVGLLVVVFDYFAIEHLSFLLYLLIVGAGGAALIYIILSSVVLLPGRKPKISYRRDSAVSGSMPLTIRCSKYLLGRPLYIEIDDEVTIKTYMGKTVTVMVSPGRKEFCIYQYKDRMTKQTWVIDEQLDFYIWFERSAEDMPLHFNVDNDQCTTYEELSKHSYYRTITIIVLISCIYALIAIAGAFVMAG